MDLLPTGVNSRASDVGAGSGRDAAWLVSRGFEVWAFEPSEVMRREAQKRHAEVSITWLDDHLPELEHTRMAASEQGVLFNIILMSAVWMHLAPQVRATAFKNLMGLLTAGGILAVTLRCGPAPAEREMYEVTEEEICQLSAEYGATVLRCLSASDQSGRPEVSWIQMALQKDL